VLVRGVVTDAGAPGEFAQRKLVTLRLAEDLERGRDDGARQVTVVVRVLGAGGWEGGHRRLAIR
jgi:hypothetical protein